MTRSEVFWFALIQRLQMKLLQLSSRAFWEMTVLTSFQRFNSLERFDCSEKQRFYCTSEFHKVYPSTLGDMLVLPNSLLLIQLLCYNFIEELRSVEVETDLQKTPNHVFLDHQPVVLTDPSHSSGPCVLFAMWTKGNTYPDPSHLCLAVWSSRITRSVVPSPPCSKEFRKQLRPGFQSGTCAHWLSGNYFTASVKRVRKNPLYMLYHNLTWRSVWRDLLNWKISQDSEIRNVWKTPW